MKFCDTHYSSIVFHHLVLWFFSVIYMCSHFESLISSSPLSLYFPLSSYSPFLSFLSSSSFSSSPVNPEHGETAHQSSKTGTSCTYCTQIYKSVSQLNFGRNLFRQHITTVHTLLVYMYMCVLFKAVLLKISNLVHIMMCSSIRAWDHCLDIMSTRKLQVLIVQLIEMVQYYLIWNLFRLMLLIVYGLHGNLFRQINLIPVSQ